MCNPTEDGLYEAIVEIWMGNYLMLPNSFRYIMNLHYSKANGWDVESISGFIRIVSWKPYLKT